MLWHIIFPMQGKMWSQVFCLLELNKPTKGLALSWKILCPKNTMGLCITTPVRSTKLAQRSEGNNHNVVKTTHFFALPKQKPVYPYIINGAMSCLCVCVSVSMKDTLDGIFLSLGRVSMLGYVFLYLIWGAGYFLISQFSIHFIKTKCVHFYYRVPEG